MLLSIIVKKKYFFQIYQTKTKIRLDIIISNKTPLSIIVKKKTTLLESTNNEIEEKRKQN